MAGIGNDPGGRRRILFYDRDGTRRTIRLGKVSERDANEIKLRIEALNSAAIAGIAVDGETAAWLANKASDKLHRKLVLVGLATPRQPPEAPEQHRLAEFIGDYIKGRTDAKPLTIMNLKLFRDRLTAFFGAERDLATIKRSDADAWLVSLKAKYAAGTVGRTVKGARQFFTAACRADIILRNPFDALKAASYPDKDRQFFVTQEVAYKVLGSCPDAE